MSSSELRAGGDAAAHQWLSALAAHGATLLRGVPCEEHRVAEVAELIGPLQPQIYGDTVGRAPSEPRPINLAYTGEAIGPHMDLCYYESPPGLQLLHCMRFDDAVAGGESVLIDGFAVGERLRRDDPAAFETLARVPATFVKDHAQRENPVLMRRTSGPTSPSTAAAASSASSGRRPSRGRSASRPPTSARTTTPTARSTAPPSPTRRRCAAGCAPATRCSSSTTGGCCTAATPSASNTDDGVRWLRGCYVRASTSLPAPVQPPPPPLRRRRRRDAAPPRQPGLGRRARRRCRRSSRGLVRYRVDVILSP